MKFANTLALTAAALILSACGGGGGDSGSGSVTTPVTDPSTGSGTGSGTTPGQPAVATYSLQGAYASLIRAGSTTNYTVGGDCTGTATFAASAPTASSFEGAAAQVVNNTTTIRLSNCVGSNVSTTQSFYDGNLNLVGNQTPSPVSYGVVAGTAVLPTAAKVGDAGDFGTVRVYGDTAKTSQIGSIVLSYAVAAETSTTVLFTLTSKSYSTTNVLLQTQQQTYRVQADGTLKPLGIDVTATSPARHLVLTAS